MAVLITLGIIFLIIGAGETFHFMPGFIDDFFALLPEVIYDYLGIGCLILGGLLIVIAVLVKVVSSAKEKKMHERMINAPTRPREIEYYSPMGLEETQAAAAANRRLTTGSDNTLRADGTLSVAKMQGGETNTVNISAPLVQGGALGGISKASAGPVDNSGLSASFLQREKEERAEYDRVQNIYKGTGSNTNPLYNPNSGGLMMGGQAGPGVGAPDFMGTQANTQAAAMPQQPVGGFVAAPSQNFNPLTGLASQAAPSANPMIQRSPMPMGGNMNPLTGGQSMGMPMAPMGQPQGMQMAPQNMQNVQMAPQMPQPTQNPKPMGGFVITSKGENPMLVQGPLGGTQGMAPVPSMNPSINTAPVQGNPAMPTMMQSAPSPIMENIPQPPVMPANMGQGVPNNNPLFRQ